MNLKQVVGQNLREIRKKRGMTLDDLSIASKMSRTYINDAERSVKALSLTSIEKISKALKIEPYLLLLKDGHKKVD